MSAVPAGSGQPLPYAGERPDLLLHLSRRRQRRAHRHRAGGRALAACVNLLPGLRSVYRWQRKVEAAAEVLLLVKTSAEAYPALQERLRQLHPYELPELLAVEAASGLPEYLQWLAAESRPVN